MNYTHYFITNILGALQDMNWVFGLALSVSTMTLVGLLVLVYQVRKK